jgi:hypothetical protein
MWRRDLGARDVRHLRRSARFWRFGGGEKMTAEYIRIMRIVNLNGNGEEERREFVTLCWKLTAPATLSHFQAVREFTLPFPFS